MSAPVEAATAAVNDTATPATTTPPKRPETIQKATGSSYAPLVGTVAKSNSTAASTTASAVIDPALEKKLIRKLDWRILPAVCMGWMLFYLDRAAIGYALINGMVYELKLFGVRINVMMMLYYIPFLLLSIPGNLLIRKVGPGLMLSAVITSWGIATLCTGFVKSYAALCVMRIIMGLTESFFLGGVMLYLNFFYTADELTARTGIFYSSTSISAAIGGLLATGLGRIKTHNYIGWSWIFFVEGIVTICIGIFAFFTLPSTLESCNFLTEAERELAIARMATNDNRHQAPKACLADTASAENGNEKGTVHTGPVGRTSMQHDKLTWDVCRRAIFKPLTLMMCVACFFNIEALTSYIMFLPTIVQSIVGPGHPIKANLLTVPPNIVAFIATIAITQWSQRWKRAGIPMVICSSIAAFGFILLLAGSKSAGPHQISPGLQYTGTFFVGIGVAALPPLALAWVSVNTAPHYVRALVLGVVITVGNTAAFLSSFTYITSEAPKYITGHAINLGCLLGMVILGTILICYMNWQNKKRANGSKDYLLDPKYYEGKMSREEYEFHLGWDHPNHRFTL